MVMGSPSYIAPEIWMGHSTDLDQRVDIYSLAVIIFRALAGRVPFDHEDVVVKRGQVLGAERPSLYQLRPDLPQDIDVWVDQALAVSRDARFHRVRAMWNALLRTLGAESDLIRMSRVSLRPPSM
jgi:serine/threonine-protein kinase